MVKQSQKSKTKPVKKANLPTRKSGNLPETKIAASKSSAVKTASRRTPSRKNGATTTPRAAKRQKRGAFQRFGDFLKGLTRCAP